MKRASMLSSALEMTKATFPQHFPVLEELRERFAMPTTRVFAYRAPTMSPYAFGIHAPYIIVFPSTVLGQLTTDEFKFALGHEMGHIKLGHTRIAPPLWRGPHAGQRRCRLIRLRNSLTASYLRAQELSCDRIGVLAARGVDRVSSGRSSWISCRLAVPRP